MHKITEELNNAPDFTFIGLDGHLRRYEHLPTASKSMYITINDSSNPFIAIDYTKDNFSCNDEILRGTLLLNNNIDLVGVRTISTIFGKPSNVNMLKSMNTITSLRDTFKNSKSKDDNDFFETIRQAYAEHEYYIMEDEYHEALMLLRTFSNSELKIISPHIDVGVKEIIEKTFNKSIFRLNDKDVSLLKIDKIYAQAKINLRKEESMQQDKIEDSIYKIKEKIEFILDMIDLKPSKPSTRLGKIQKKTKNKGVKKNEHK